MKRGSRSRDTRGEGTPGQEKSGAKTRHEEGGCQQGNRVTGAEMKVGGDRRWCWSPCGDTALTLDGRATAGVRMEKDRSDLNSPMAASCQCGPGGDNGPPDHGAAAGSMRIDHSPGDFEP